MRHKMRKMKWLRKELKWGWAKGKRIKERREKQEGWWKEEEEAAFVSFQSALGWVSLLCIFFSLTAYLKALCSKHTHTQLSLPAAADVAASSAQQILRWRRFLAADVKQQKITRAKKKKVSPRIIHRVRFTFRERQNHYSRHWHVEQKKSLFKKGYLLQITWKSYISIYFYLSGCVFYYVYNVVVTSYHTVCSFKWEFNVAPVILKYYAGKPKIDQLWCLFDHRKFWQMTKYKCKDSGVWWVV